MNTIKLGSSCPDALFLQAAIGGLTLDGQFGKKTEDALKSYQTSKGLDPDGIAGPSVWTNLVREKKSVGLKEEDYVAISKFLSIEVAAVKAVKEVESGSAGAFFPSSRPSALFEGHIFWSKLKAQGIKPESVLAGNEDILFPKWDRKKYQGGDKEWARLEKAWKINPTAAMESASLGLFQIMGFNWKSTGANSLSSYYAENWLKESQQLQFFAGFIKSNGLDKYLRSLDWRGFALKYNGPGADQNNYPAKLKAAYAKHKK